MAYDKVASSPSEDDWRARDDHSTLMRACEVMADKMRMKGVMREQGRKQAAERNMKSMLAKHKAGKTRV